MAVFSAIDETERANGVHLENKNVALLNSNAEARAALAVVLDFLQRYGFTTSRSCLLEECGLVSPTREALVCPHTGLCVEVRQTFTMLPFGRNVIAFLPVCAAALRWKFDHSCAHSHLTPFPLVPVSAATGAATRILGYFQSVQLD